jgi:hypothetical protein
MTKRPGVTVGGMSKTAGGASATSANHDQMLKLRTRRILWAQGYHCPLEVDLSHFEYNEQQKSLRRSSFTDIDLLAIKFDPDLRKRIIVADCKSGAESEPNRLFWLRGVMSFFGASEGLFVKTALRNPARALAPRLGIRVLDQNALTVLEQAVKVDMHTLPSIGDKIIDDQIHELWGIRVAKGGKPDDNQLKIKNTYQYLQYLYWMIDDYRNIQTVVDRFSGITDLLDAGALADRYLCYVGLERFALSLLNMAGEIAGRDVDDIERQSRFYLFGGSLALRERQNIIELLNRIAAKQDLFKQEIRLEPSYFEELIEIINRLIKNSREAAAILHHLDAVVYGCVLDRQIGIEQALGPAYRTDALVLGKRIANLFQKTAGLPQEIFSELFNL